MKIRVLSVFLVVCCLYVSGCTKQETVLGPKTEVSSYSEETLDVKGALSLEVLSDTSNIEVYAWDKSSVKFEITKKIRGTESKDILKAKLEDFKIDINKEDNKIIFSSKYDGKASSLADKSVDLKIFLPQNTDNIYCKVDIGTIKFYDDLYCNLKAEIKTANIDINKIEGRVNLTGDMGNLTIHEGKVKAGSSAKVNFGNITIKAAFEEGGEYGFETGVGNLEFKLPEESRICIEGIGNVEINEFNDTSYPTKVKLNSGMGKITAVKS